MIFSTRFSPLLLAVLLLLFGASAVRAQVPVSGRVTDASGPLVGVSVIIKGANGGTSTNTDGNFTINVPSADAVLVFSYIGYIPREIQVGRQSKLDVLLEADTKALDEVVVVGYGTKTRADLTGSVSTIKGTELEKSPASNLTNSIAGRVPGLIANTRSGEPGNDNAEIFVRGKATLGSTGTLVVIDGIPDRSGGFARLNPADIESFTVIKDATAAIYGARSANGVILITTKRGQAGKPVLSIGTNWSLTQATRVPQMLNSYEYALATNEYDQMIGQKPTWPDASLQKFRDGSDPLSFPSTDWWDATMKKQALQHNQVISLRGGTDKVTYFLSGQYQKQDGIYKKDAAYYKQAQARANVDIAVTDNLKIGVDLLYRNEFRNSAVGNYNAGAIFRELWLAYPYLVPIYPNGLVGPGIGGGPNNSMVYITSGEAGYNRATNDFLQTKTYFKWDLSKAVDGLFVDGYYAYDLTFSKTKAFTKTPPPSFRYDGATGNYVQINSAIKPSLSELRGTLKQNLVNIRLGYNNRFGDHSVEGFAAYERFEGSADEISAFRSNFLSNSLDQLSAGSLIGQQNNSTAAQTGRNNFIARASYGFKNKYLFDYNMRYDGSQNFPEGKRYGFFPAVSAAWRISQEDFFNSKSITELKLRGSWGKTGNDVVSAFNYIQTYLLGTGYGYSLGPTASQVSSLVPGPTPNKDITWEVATTTDVALDAQFLKGKLGLTIDYFRSMRSGILITRSESVPAYTGLTLPNQNLGKVLNRGIELEAYYNGTIGTSFGYNIRGNLTFARNKVIFMDEAASVPSYQRKTDIPIDSWLVYESDGLYQNQAEIDASPHPANTAPGDIRYKDINGDGAINGLDQVRQSSVRTPELIYGTSLGFSWKNLDLSLFVQGQARAQSYLAPAGLNMAREFFDGRWQKEGDNQFPRNFNGPTGASRGVNTLTSDFWLRNAAFVRLKNVELGFTVPSGVLKKAKMHSTRIYINGSNLFSIDKFGPSFDPEIPNNSGYYYPQQRVVNLGANISF